MLFCVFYIIVIVCEHYSFMNELLLEKKDILLKILTSLQGTWDMAESLIEVIQHAEIDEVFIDGFFDIVEKWLQQIKNTANAEQIEKALSALQKIKAIETRERTDELSQCASLQKTLEDFTIF